MMDGERNQSHMELDMTKATIRTVLNNVICQDGHFTYDQQLVWSKWVAETNTQPQPFVEVIQPHLGHNLDTGNSSSECEIPSDKPRDKEGVQ